MRRNKYKRYVVYGTPKKGSRLARQGWESITEIINAYTMEEAMKLFKSAHPDCGRLEAEVAKPGRYY